MKPLNAILGVVIALSLFPLLSPGLAQAAPADEAAIVEESAAATEPVQEMAQLTKTDVDAWLDGLMPYALREGDIVGAVVSIVKDGKLLTSRGFGYADIETREPMDPANSLVRPGSVAKLFTWTAIMQLVEEDEIDLDADINAYLDFDVRGLKGDPITVRHLMTHTGGFEETLKDLIARDPEGVLPIEEYVKKNLPARMFAPGTTPAYSNYGTALAGYIVERVSGEDYYDYIDRHILDPLDMSHSTFRQPLPDDLPGEMSKAYTNASDGKPMGFEYVGTPPAGSLTSTANDMAKFMIAHLSRGGPLLRPKTAEEMHTTYDAHLPPLNAQALGFYQQDRFGLRSLGHGGDTVYFHSDLSLFHDHNVGLFVSFNSSGKDATTLFLREDLARLFGERYFPESAPVQEKRLSTAREHGAQLVGSYEDSRSNKSNFLALLRYLGQTAIAQNDDGDLVLSLAGRELVWREVEPYVWRKVGGPERLSATFTDGKVYQLSFEPFSPSITYTPAPWYRDSSLLNPLLFGALFALSMTVILWPTRAIIRRRYKVASAASHSAFASRLVRIGVVLVFAYLLGWVLLFANFMSTIPFLPENFDSKLRVMQFAQFTLYAAFAVALWNMIVNWTRKRSWFAKTWSVVLPASIAIMIWFAAIAGLLSFSLTY
ncbi:serine hydrolase domain-containing protein [Hyphococcus sp.]|uniref:serine hydrolase domain-containing protein n=1 Tax=Hyphococcus sp. TaxID=2038636 RepID=UPI0035C6CBEE